MVVRSDEKLDKSIVSSKDWDNDPVTGRRDALVNRYSMPSQLKGKMSLSGHERNHLFQSARGEAFSDIAGVSGLDSPKDGRSFAVWDFNRDGWQDIALANTNTPVLHLFKNQAGSHDGTARAKGSMVALKFVGGNNSARPSTKFSARNGYGVKVTVKLADKTIVREHRCGEGLAAQNSSTMMIGIGQHASVESITIRWPAGTTQRFQGLAAGELLTVYENAAQSPDRSGFARSRYLVEPKPRPALPPRSTPVAGTFRLKAAEGQSAELLMYTSVASWCSACREHLPELDRIRARFGPERLGMFGVPTDKDDPREKLDKFVREHRPAYRQISVVTQSEREGFDRVVEKKLGAVMMPSTIVATREGQVLGVFPGIPTVSELAALLQRRDRLGR